MIKAHVRQKAVELAVKPKYSHKKALLKSINSAFLFYQTCKLIFVKEMHKPSKAIVQNQIFYILRFIVSSYPF